MSVLAKADFFHTREYIHIQLANSNIVKTSDLSRKNLAEVESEVEVKYWIGGTTGETGFHSILFARFYICAGIPAEFPLAPWYKSPHQRTLQREMTSKSSSSLSHNLLFHSFTNLRGRYNRATVINP